MNPNRPAQKPPVQEVPESRGYTDYLLITTVDDPETIYSLLEVGSELSALMKRIRGECSITQGWNFSIMVMENCLGYTILIHTKQEAIKKALATEMFELFGGIDVFMDIVRAEMRNAIEHDYIITVLY